MLDLKAKLLAAGVVTADQVKKVEDDEAAKKQRAHEARERRERGPPPVMAKPKKGHDVDDEDEKRARREHEWNEAQRWRQRLDALKSAGKSEQYEAIRGWVMKDRLDNAKISEAAVRFHFVKDDGAVSHLTVEPDVQARLTAGTAAVVAFMGYNGREHAAVPKDVADDVRAVKPEWVRHLVGVTDLAAVDAPLVEISAEGAAASTVADDNGDTSAEAGVTTTQATEAPSA